MPFHRYKNPAYNLLGGSFPGGIGSQTYDLINVISEGVGGGDGSSNTDTAKAGGPNAGTYFVAFGEDATSSFANRGMRALSENTDHLDDILRTNIPLFTQSNFGSPSANNLQIFGDIFVGDDPGGDAKLLVGVVTNPDGYLPYNGVNPVLVTDIDDGTPGNSVVGDGWVTDPTIRFNLPLIQGVTVTYGTRTSTSKIAESEREGNWRGFFFNHLIASDAKHHEVHGLDERYRRSTDITSPDPATDTAGSGSTIIRDGQAITTIMPWLETRPGIVYDILQSNFRCGYENQTHGSFFQAGYGGDIGLAMLVSDRMTGSNAFEQSGLGDTRGAVASFIPRNVTDASNDGGARTFINTGVTTGIIDPGGLGGANAQILELDGAWFFKNAEGSAIWSNYDIIVLDLGGGSLRSFRIFIDRLLPDNQARLRAIGGAQGNQDIGNNVPVTVVGWYHAHTTFGGTEEFGATIRHPKYLGDNQTDQISNGHRGYYGAMADNYQDFQRFEFFDDEANEDAVRWHINGSGDCGTPRSNLGRIDDGNTKVTKAGGVLRYNFAHRFLQLDVPSFASESLRVDLSGAQFELANLEDGAGFGCYYIKFTGANNENTAITFNTNFGNQEGGFFEIVLHDLNGVFATVNWSTLFKFSDPLDAQPTFNNLEPGKVVKYRGTIVSTGVALMERVDYTL